MSKIRETLNAAEKSNADITTIFRMVPKSLNDHLVDLKNLKLDIEKLIKESSTLKKNNDVLSKKVEILTAELDETRKQLDEKELIIVQLKSIPLSAEKEPEIEPEPEPEPEKLPEEPTLPVVIQEAPELEKVVSDEIDLTSFHFELTNGKYRYGTKSTTYNIRETDLETTYNNIPNEINSADTTYGNRKRVSALMKLLYMVYGGELFTRNKKIHYRKSK